MFTHALDTSDVQFIYVCVEIVVKYCRSMLLVKQDKICDGILSI